MGENPSVPAACATLRRLTKQEIDRRIGVLVAELVDGSEADGTSDAGGSLHPRWIAAGELVRRLQPFLVYN
jgi:hypothetical protein